jgi:hypothetical protein
MKTVLKYIIIYLFYAFFWVMINALIEKSDIMNAERFFVLYLIVIFYGWMFFVPILIIFRFGLIELYKYCNYKGLFLICTLWGATVNSLQFFFTASNVGYLQTFSFLISGVAFGTIYYLFFLFSFNDKINK